MAADPGCGRGRGRGRGRGPSCNGAGGTDREWVEVERRVHVRLGQMHRLAWALLEGADGRGRRRRRVAAQLRVDPVRDRQRVVVRKGGARRSHPPPAWSRTMGESEVTLPIEGVLWLRRGAVSSGEGRVGVWWPAVAQEAATTADVSTVRRPPLCSREQLEPRGGVVVEGQAVALAAHREQQLRRVRVEPHPCVAGEREAAQYPLARRRAEERAVEAHHLVARVGRAERGGVVAERRRRPLAPRAARRCERKDWLRQDGCGAGLAGRQAIQSPRALPVVVREAGQHHDATTMCRKLPGRRIVEPHHAVAGRHSGRR